MNTTQFVQEMSAVNFEKWLFATIFSVAISGFLTLIVGELSHWSAIITGAVLWLTTSFFSCWAQILVIRSSLHVQISRWAPWLLVSSILGWMISFLLVYLLAQKVDIPSIDSKQILVFVLLGIIGGGAIGFFPGLFSSLAYLQLMRPARYDIKRLFINNVFGWCLGMGLASASILVLFAIIVSNLFTIF